MKNEPTQKGVIYARYSPGPNQTERSIEGQVADCEAYAARNGIEIIKVYADRHVSGRSMKKRDELMRMLDDADKHLFDVVLTWKNDRLGRDRYELVINKHRLRSAGIQIFYAVEHIPKGPEGIILEGLLETMAEYYSEELSQKIQRGIRENAKKGIYTFPLPMGYIRNEDRRVIPDPERAPLVLEAFKLFAGGAQGPDLRRFFEEHYITGKGGRPISNNFIYSMLRNEHYLGRFELQGISIDVEPIIPEELFYQVQEIFNRPGRKQACGQGRAKVKYLLSCKCRCGYCGGTVSGVSGTGKSGKVYNYYKCTAGKRKGGSCELKPVPISVLEDAVLKHTMECMLTDEVIDMLTEKIMEIQDQDDEQARVKALEAELASVRRKIRNTADAIAEGAGKTMVQYLGTLEQREEELEAESARAKIKAPRVTKEIVKAWLLSFRDGDIADVVFREHVLDTFVHHVEIKNGEAVVFYNATEPASSKCSYVITTME